MKAVAGRIFALWVAFWMVALAFFCCFLLIPLAIVPRGQRERWATPIAAGYCWFCTRILLGVKPEIIGCEHLPDQPGYLVICNHRSWLDVPLLVYATRSLGIAKKELAYIPFFGLGAWVAGVLFFDRNNKASRQKVLTDAIDRISMGANLHVFPEGTRTRTGKLAEKVFLRLLEHCYTANIQVVPVCTWDTEKTLPTNKIWAWFGNTAGLEIAPPVKPEHFASPTAFAQAAWGVVVEKATQHGSNVCF